MATGIFSITLPNPTYSIQRKSCVARSGFRSLPQRIRNSAQSSLSGLFSRNFAAQACLSQIRVGNVLLDHALGVEERAVDGNGVLHDLDVEARLFVEHRENDVLEFPVKGFGFFGVVCDDVAGFHGAERLADGPSCYAFDVALRPRAVEDA